MRREANAQAAKANVWEVTVRFNEGERVIGVASLQNWLSRTRGSWKSVITTALNVCTRILPDRECCGRLNR